MRKLRFSEKAEADLESIGDYLVERNATVAVRFIREIRTRCSHLIQFPYSHPILKGYEVPGFRRLVHQQYLIFYVVRDDAVEIVRVIHGAREYSELLEDTASKTP